MDGAKSHLALLCIFLMLASSAGMAADNQASNIQPPATAGIHGLLGRITSPFKGQVPPPVNLANSGRLESLMRAGNLYLSLQDAIALSLENNLDIEIQRYGPQIADTSVLRAQAGGFARGVSTSVSSGATSATGGAGGGAATGVNQNAAAQASAAASSAVGSTLIQQTGSAIPSLDPTMTGALRWGHTTTPQTSTFVTGTTALIQKQNISQVGIQKGFLSGTIVNLALSNSGVSSNNPRSEFNPATNSTLGLTLTQHLLQGFGAAVNSRQIRIAKNNREVADLTFKQQVITTVSAIINLYWDLVTFNQDVRVKRDALAASQKLYGDNQKQVEVGTLAPIEVVRAEAEVASRQQDLTISETRLLQQETIIKNALSRNGVASPTIADAHIIPTDHISVPDVEPIAPIQDMVGMALSARPELAQSRIQITNSEINLRGDKSALKPTLDAVVTLNNNALSGEPSALAPLAGSTRNPNPFFVGGYGTALTQMLSRNFPDYSLAFSLNVPLRNRAAQADMLNDELSLRQQQLSLQRLQNQVRVDVQNALVGLTQARAQYQAATKARFLQERTLDAEQQKLALGASTIYNVILAQRDLLTAQSNEVAAMSTYAKAKVELNRATGQTLYNNNISLDEAFKGVVSRPPSAIPDTPSGAANR